MERTATVQNLISVYESEHRVRSEEIERVFCMIREKLADIGNINEENTESNERKVTDIGNNSGNSQEVTDIGKDVSFEDLVEYLWYLNNATTTGHDSAESRERKQYIVNVVRTSETELSMYSTSAHDACQAVMDRIYDGQFDFEENFYDISVTGSGENDSFEWHEKD